MASIWMASRAALPAPLTATVATGMPVGICTVASRVNKLIKLPVNAEESDLKLLSAVLNASMTDIPLEGFTPELLEKVMRSAGAAASLVPVILDFTQETLKNHGNTNMAVYGQSRLLGLPEYQDVDKAQRLMASIDEDALSNLPAVMRGSSGTKVLVGPENVAQELKDTSVVMTKFDIGDSMQGMGNSASRRGSPSAMATLAGRPWVSILIRWASEQVTFSTSPSTRRLVILGPQDI